MCLLKAGIVRVTYFFLVLTFLTDEGQLLGAVGFFPAIGSGADTIEIFCVAWFTSVGPLGKKDFLQRASHWNHKIHTRRVDQLDKFWLTDANAKVHNDN